MPSANQALARLQLAEEILAGVLGEPLPGLCPPEHPTWDLEYSEAVYCSLVLFRVFLNLSPGIAYRTGDLEYQLMEYLIPWHRAADLLHESTPTAIIVKKVDPQAWEWLQSQCDSLGPPYELSALERRASLKQRICDQLWRLQPEHTSTFVHEVSR